jgi:hypothetical protein
VRGASGYRSRLAFALSQSAVAYGYTLSVWTSGAVLINRHGKPTPTDAVLFLAGGVAAFVLIALVATRGFRDRLPADSGAAVLAGALNFLSAGAALGSSLLIALLHAHTLVWPLAAFALTTVYLLCTGAQITLADHLAGG